MHLVEEDEFVFSPENIELDPDDSRRSRASSYADVALDDDGRGGSSYQQSRSDAYSMFDPPRLDTEADEFHAKGRGMQSFRGWKQRGSPCRLIVFAAAVFALVTIIAAAVVVWYLHFFSEETHVVDRSHLLKFLGTSCHVVNGRGCNPHQLMSQEDATPPYSPGQRLVPLLDADLMVSSQRFLSDWYEGSAFRSLPNMSAVLSASFGLGASSVITKIAFGGSVGFEAIFESMFFQARPMFFARAIVRYSIETGVVRQDASLMPSHSLNQVIRTLPDSVHTEEDAVPYLEMFEAYGTHFVRRVDFGGHMQLLIMLDAVCLEATAMTQTARENNLFATLQATVSLNSSWNPAGVTEESLAQFHACVNTSSLGVHGGDESIRDFTRWMPTVVTNPLPVHTELSFISRLFPTAKQQALDTSYEMFLDGCPRSSDDSPCSGYGICNRSTERCRCAPARNGSNCELFTCHVDCQAHGTCDNRTGMCTCDANWGGCDTRSEEGSGTAPQPLRQCVHPCGERVMKAADLIDTDTRLPYDHCSGPSLDCGLPSASCTCNLTWMGSTAVDASFQSVVGQSSVYPCTATLCANSTDVRCEYFTEIQCTQNEVCTQPIDDDRCLKS